MRVLITGASGLIGRELARLAPVGVAVEAVSRQRCDLADSTSIARLISVCEPALVINAAAYTALDDAESDSEQAWRVNALAPGLLAQAAGHLRDCRLLQISTDCVFSGESSRFYLPEDKPEPLSVYGKTKLEGERRALDLLGNRALILRTAWVYGSRGKSFLDVMLRQMREHRSVRVVSDRIGCPTSVASLAEVIWALARRRDLDGIYHWTDAGVASWYDFAVAISEEAVAAGVVVGPIEVIPKSTSDIPTHAKRPQFSLLDCRRTATALAIRPRHWRARLREVLKEMTRS